jgi:HPt (histidine-containing phosphotransfer) domain-containing protein
MKPIHSVYEDDPDMLELVQEFASEMPDRARALEQCLVDAELEELQRLAHQLKGAGGGYGFTQITEAAASLEEGLKSGAAPEVVKERTQQLCDTLRAVVVPEAV